MSGHSFAPHDHGPCVTDAMTKAEAYCTTHKLQFTPVRRRVLEILLDRHQAMGAYEILDMLKDEGLGSQPPVAYRALDFLVQHGMAHRIEQINAYAACMHPGRDHAPAFLVCRNCKAVSESEVALDRGLLGDAARSSGFVIETTVIEARGLCPTCAEIPA